MGGSRTAHTLQKITTPCEKSMREFSVIIERDEEGWFVATVPGLRGCHTQAKSLDQLVERVKEAIALCLEIRCAA
jgi:predicted RNase H-like HicB family nuclease